MMRMRMPVHTHGRLAGTNSRNFAVSAHVVKIYLFFMVMVVYGSNMGIRVYSDTRLVLGRILDEET